MTIREIFRVIWLSILFVILQIRVGPDVPNHSEMLNCSLNNGPVACVQTAEGYTADFTASYEQIRRPILAGKQRYDFDLKVANTDESLAKYPDDVLNYEFDEDDEDYDPKDYYRENLLWYDVFPSMNASYTMEIEGDPYLIKEGDQYVLHVHITLPKNTPSGTYTVSFSWEYEREHVYNNVLIVP